MKRIQLLTTVLVLTGLAVPAPVHAQFLKKSLAAWTKQLDDKDAQARRSAAFALGKFPDAAGQVIGPLLDRLKNDKDTGVRDAAASALGDVIQANKSARGDIWMRARPALAEALQTERDEHVLRAVLYAVGSFEEDGAPLLDEVQAKLKHQDALVRQNAAWALGRMGPKAEKAVDDLIVCLSDKEALVRRDAATALGDIGLPAAKAAIRPLLNMAAKEDDEVAKKTALAKVIDLVGPDNKDSVDLLLPHLNNEDPETTYLAAFVLAKIGGDEAKPAVKALRDALNDDEPLMQRRAAGALSNLGPVAAPAVPDLGKALRNSPDKEVRRNCALALGHVGEQAKDAVPDLVAALKSDKSIEVRHYAAEALARMKSPANEAAFPDVLKVLAKSEPFEREEQYTTTTMRQRCIWCFFTVSQLPPEAIPVLTAVLDETGDDGLMVRYDAARLLAGDLGDKAPDKAADWLLHMLRNDKLLIYTRSDAKVSGGGTETGSGNATVKATIGGDARFLAADALGRMGKKAANNPEIVAELKKAAKEAKDDKLREEAATALKRLGIQ